MELLPPSSPEQENVNAKAIKIAAKRVGLTLFMMFSPYWGIEPTSGGGSERLENRARVLPKINIWG
jgi:hypothetical protein